MSRLKVLIVGPPKSGKSTLANILGDLQDGPSSIYRPTIGCRWVKDSFNFAWTKLYLELLTSREILLQASQILEKFTSNYGMSAAISSMKNAGLQCKKTLMALFLCMIQLTPSQKICWTSSFNCSLKQWCCNLNSVWSLSIIITSEEPVRSYQNIPSLTAWMDSTDMKELVRTHKAFSEDLRNILWKF